MKNKKSFAPQEAEARPSRCPDNSAFKQQRLPAWKPQLTIATVLSTFFLTGAFCLSVGICLILSANSVKEIQVCLEWGVRCSIKKKSVYVWEKRALSLCFWIKNIAMASCLGHVKQTVFLWKSSDIWSPMKAKYWVVNWEVISKICVGTPTTGW